MKKLVLGLCMLLFLCGCEGERREYLVSAIGVMETERGFSLCAEEVIINTEKNEQSLRLIKGEGETLEEAVEKIKSQSVQPLLFSHCGVIAIGQGVADATLKEVCEYAIKSREITLSAYILKTENPIKLLSAKPVSSLSAGYEIMAFLRQNSSYRNRLFELAAKDYKTDLPVILIEDGGFVIENK